jgi:LysM repeat protein
MFQVGVLKNSPYKLKEKLQGKEGMQTLRNLIENLQTSQTIDLNLSQLDPEEVLRQIEEQQTDFKIRANAFINSVSEIEVFTKRIQTIVEEMKQSNEYLTNEGMAKLAYYQQFLERQDAFLDEIKDTLKMQPDNLLNKKLLSIGERVRNTITESRKLEKEFMKEFIVDNSDFMNESISNTLKEKLTNILKADDYTDAEIEAVADQIINTKDLRRFDVKDLNLPKPTRYSKAILDAVQNYFAKVITKEKITDLLEGKAGDLGIMASMITPYSNIDDPLGSFVRYMKAKLSNAETKSYREWNDFMSTILPELKAAGYNPNDTGQLASLLMFTDKVPSRNDKGEYEEFEVLSLIDKFKDWRGEIGRLNDALEKAREIGEVGGIRKAQKDIWEFNDKYMHRKYKKEVYDVQRIWFQDNRVYDPSTKTEIVVSADIATQAFLERQKAIDQMSIFNKRPFTELDEVMDVTESQIAKREYDELYHIYDKFGKFKTGDELQKVLIRLHHRKKSAGFNEFITDNNKFQRDLDNYVNVQLSSQGIVYDESDPEKMKEFNEELQKFFNKNLKIATTPEYQQRLQEIYQQLREIGSKNSQTDTVKELSEYYRQRSALVALVTDKDGEPNGADLSIDQIRLLKSLEDKIVELNAVFDKKTGLTIDQKRRLDQYQQKLMDGAILNSIENDDYIRLLEVKNELGLSSLELTNLKMLFKELAELTNTTATDQYLKTFNDVVGDTEIQQLLADNTIGMGAVEAITADTADEFINSPAINQIKAANTAFAEWFDRNHYSKSYFDKNGEEVTKYYRIKAWSVTRPSNQKYYVKTKIINPANGLELDIPGVPISKYTYTRVKDQYRTIPRDADKSKYVGTIIDNKGRYLPREYTPGDVNSAYDRKYENEQYYKLKAENGAQFRLLEAYKKQYLKLQEGKAPESKLYLDMPRFRKKSNLEYIQSGEARANFGSKLEGIKGGALAMFKKDAADAEHNFNFDTDNLLIDTDLQGEVITEIPVRGLYRINKNEVSQDVLTATATYLHSLNEQQTLIEEEPVAKALKNILNDPANAIKQVNKVSKQASKARGKQVFIPKGRNKFKRENQRGDAYSYYIDRLFYGQGSSEFQNENVWVTKLANNLMGAASRSFIALDVTSALKNKLGMTFQKMIEVAGGQYLNAVSAAQGRMKSFSATVELSSKGIYSKGPKSLDLQMMEQFDPITGKTKQDFGKSSSRTFVKDFLDGTWMYDSRRLMEVESGLQLFYGMMYHKEIEQTQPDGSVKKIKYVEAFELNSDNQMVLKEGINPEWGTMPVDYEVKAGDTLESIAAKYHMTAEELKAKNKLTTDNIDEGQQLIISRSKNFNDFKLKIQGVGKKLNGLIAEEDSPQADKYLMFRLFTFYRKYAVPMFLNRFQFDTSKENFGGEIYDWDLGTTTKGYYISAFQAMYKTIKDGGKYWNIMTKEEKSSLKKVAAEGLYLALLAIAVTFIFGYDKGDEDRFEKMQNREDQYGAFGWLANHALYQLIMVKRENESFIPVPGIGLDEWLEFTNSTTIVTGPTLDLYSKIMMDLWYMISGNERGIYKSETGPYPWQQEGSYKLWNHMAGIFGVKGKNVAPIWAIKKNEAFENLN